MTVRRLRKSWWVDFRFKRKRYREKSPVNSRRGAEEYERELLKRLIAEDAGVVPTPAKERKEVPKCAAFLKEWLETYACTNSKPSGYYGKKAVVRNHLTPFFGKLRLDEIGVREIDKFKAAQVEKGYSAKTTNNHLSVLRRALTSAEEWGHLTSVPKVKWLKVPPSQFDFLVAEEGERLVAAADAEHRTMVLMALRTGLRVGELLALRWQDVDLVAKKVMVRRSLWKTTLGTPKNGRTREVPLSDGMVQELKQHRHLKGELVFCRADGSMYTRDAIKRVLPFACKRAGLRHVQWHALRHSFASQLVMAGVSLKVVQELMGHATLEMTMRYAHLAPSIHVDAVAKLDTLSNTAGGGGKDAAIR